MTALLALLEKAGGAMVAVDCARPICRLARIAQAARTLCRRMGQLPHRGGSCDATLAVAHCNMKKSQSKLLCR